VISSVCPSVSMTSLRNCLRGTSAYFVIMSGSVELGSYWEVGSYLQTCKPTWICNGRAARGPKLAPPTAIPAHIVSMPIRPCKIMFPMPPLRHRLVQMSITLNGYKLSSLISRECRS